MENAPSPSLPSEETYIAHGDTGDRYHTMEETTSLRDGKYLVDFGSKKLSLGIGPNDERLSSDLTSVALTMKSKGFAIRGYQSESGESYLWYERQATCCCLIPLPWFPPAVTAKRGGYN